MSRNPEMELYVYRDDEDSYSPEKDLNWDYVRSQILAEVAIWEMRTRLVGFSLLGIGFVIQIFGMLL